VSFTVILALGLAQFALALRFLMTRSDASARTLFVGSITYLRLLWTVMILGKQ
jgi:heme O synthase-like polyprenyltransferase